MVNEKVVNAILSYGNRYREEMLYKIYTKDKLLDNWWEALKFFFGRAFYQGRRDPISDKVYLAAVGVLEAEQSNMFSDYKNWEFLKEELEKKIGKGKIGKARDIDMVISTLEYMGKLPNRNIVIHSLERINSGKIFEHYKELQSQFNSEGIIQVGPKISSFYLRDVISLFQLENKIPDDLQFYLQPVDVWVRKVAIKIGIAKSDATDDQIRQVIVKLCQEQRCSPLQFNQGAWYVGNNAFDFLLENLEKYGV